MRRLFVIVVVVVGVVCTSCRMPLTGAAPEHSEIVEALFRHIARAAPVTDADSHSVNLVHKVYFLEVDSGDPTPSFLSRLRDLNVPVEPLSASVLTNFYRYEKKTGQLGAAFSIQNVRLTGFNRAEADADTNPGGPLRGSGLTYHLAKRAGKWVVVGEKVRWIS